MCTASAKSTTLALFFVEIWQEYIRHFRLKELKEALGRLSLPRSGKKNELQQRLYDVLQEPRTMVSLGSYIRTPAVSLEEAARVVTEVYRELQGSTRRTPNQLTAVANEITNAMANGTNGNANGNAVDAPATEHENGVIRCPCGVNADSHQLMVQCDGCGVWVHCSCFGLGAVESDLPAQYYCDVCRAARADPFWQSVAVVFPSTMLQAVAQQSNPMLLLERTFLLTRSHMRMLQSKECELQVMCILLNDAVPFRLHWPTFANLRVNVMPVRVYTRGGQQQLGNNARDEPAKISAFVREGINRVALTAYDTRPFALMIVLSRQRLLQELTAQVVRDESQDAYEVALEMVRQRCGGGKSSEAEDGDDNDLVALSSVVSLRDPLGGMRIQEPGRYRDCTHLACFDIPTYLEMQQRTRKWQCPICLKHAAIETLYIDPYFLRVLQALQQDEDATEIELAADASWRPRDEDGKVLNEAWHPPEFGAPLLPPVAASQPTSNGVHELSDAEDESTQDASRKRVSQGAGSSAAPAKKPKGATMESAISLSDSDDEAPAAAPSAQMKSEGEGVTSNQSEPDFARLLASFTTDSQATNSIQDSTFPAYASLAQGTSAPSTSYSSSVEHSTNQGRFNMSLFSTLHTSQPAEARNVPWGSVPSTSMWPQLSPFGQPHASYNTRPRAIRPQPMLPSSWQTQHNFGNAPAPVARTTRPHASTAHQFNLSSNPWRQVSSQVNDQTAADDAPPPVVSSAASTLLNLTSSPQQSSYYNAPLELGPLPSSTFNTISNGHSPQANQAHILTPSTAISLDSDDDDDDGEY
eukprot:jgi/Chlat1/7401/Chrsp6S07487